MFRSKRVCDSQEFPAYVTMKAHAGSFYSSHAASELFEQRRYEMSEVLVIFLSRLGRARNVLM